MEFGGNFSIWKVDVNIPSRCAPFELNRHVTILRVPPAAFFKEKNEPHNCAFLDIVSVACHPNYWKSLWMLSQKFRPLRFQLSFLDVFPLMQLGFSHHNHKAASCQTGGDHSSPGLYVIIHQLLRLDLKAIWRINTSVATLISYFVAVKAF